MATWRRPCARGASDATSHSRSQVPDLQVPPEDYAEDDLVIRQETTEIESLLSLDGIRFLFTSLLVKVAPAWAITWIIVFVGMLSSVASDAGYLILIPLAAAAFLSVGRHPLAGLAAAYAG